MPPLMSKLVEKMEGEIYPPSDDHSISGFITLENEDERDQKTNKSLQIKSKVLIVGMNSNISVLIDQMIISSIESYSHIFWKNLEYRA
jgi:hypothetical protein